MSNNCEVKLIAYTQKPLDVVYTAMRTCYYTGTSIEMFEKCKNTSKEEKEKLVQKVLSSNHTSPLEHIYFTFAISDIDRNCSHQLVRTRLASYSQQSLRYTNILQNCDIDELTAYLYGNKPVEDGIKLASRYYTDVNEDNYQYYIMSIVKYIKAINSGVKKEEARNLLCSNIKTTLVMSIDLRSFLNLVGHRACSRAQKPIRALANKMIQEVKATGEFDFIKNQLGPKCEQNGFCDEGAMCCGRKPTLEQLINKDTDKVINNDGEPHD